MYLANDDGDLPLQLLYLSLQHMVRPRYESFSQMLFQQSFAVKYSVYIFYF